MPVESRQRLVDLMLDTVLAALRSSRSIDHVAVVSPERGSVPAEIPVLPDTCDGLNPALQRARTCLHEFGVKELVVLPADLPFVRGADVDALVAAGRRSGFALASDVAGVGTNALYLKKGMSFDFRFGTDSCLQHLRQAVQAGLEPQQVHFDGLEFDLDIHEDLVRLGAHVDARFRSFLPLTGEISWLTTQQHV